MAEHDDLDRPSYETESDLLATLLQARDEAESETVRAALDAGLRWIQDLLAERERLRGSEAALTEARALLACDPIFQCGPLLSEAPSGWSHGWLTRMESSYEVRIGQWKDPVRGQWHVELIGLGFVLQKMGEWDRMGYEVTNDHYLFPTPSAALAALDVWRSARRSELAQIPPSHP